MIGRSSDRTGFTIVEVLVLVAAVAVIGALGFTYYSRMNKQVASVTSQSPVASDVSGAPEVTQSSDLDKAAVVLDQTDLATSDSDMTQIESMSSDF